MAFIRKRRIGKGTYYYVIENRRRGGKVRQKVLQYLGRKVDANTLRKALDYWEEAGMAKKKFGARVVRLPGNAAVVKQTYKIASDRSDRYKIHTMTLSGAHRERFVSDIKDVRALGKAVLAALQGKLTS